MVEKPPERRIPLGSSSYPVENFRNLSQRILLCANEIRPTVNFLFELSDILLTFSACDAVELWLQEKGFCSRWEATRTPRRFFRLENLPCNNPEEILQHGDRAASGSTLFMPLLAGEKSIGAMRLKSDNAACVSRRSRELYHYISQTVAMAISYHRVHLEQRERVKELTCLYRIARAASREEVNIDTIMSEIVAFLPSAWQYPEIAVGKILLDDRSYSTGAMSSLRDVQHADIVIDGLVRGAVEVGYAEDRPELDEGPFLSEERNLIDMIAREVAAIVERKKAEEDRARLQNQLRHADRLATIGQLAAGVAHELNEPLGGILGFAQLASKTADLPGEARDDLGKIEAAALHAREVVRKLMLFARQTTPAMKLVNLNEIVEEGLYFLESRCVKAGIELSRSLLPDLPPITADPAQIHQVLINLVVNSVQAMRRGGSLEVNTCRQGNHVVLIVADTGDGMSDEIKEQIFIPFFTTKDVSEGTGLGLPVVHGIVTSHGGEIEVQSQPGSGSRFLVRFPAVLAGGSPEPDEQRGSRNVQAKQ